jgi:hypothetical protein
MVAYEKESQPPHRLAVRDGFVPLGRRADREIKLGGPPFPDSAGRRVGLVAYGGDRRGDSLSVSTGRGAPAVLSDPDNPPDDVLNSRSPIRSPPRSNVCPVLERVRPRLRCARPR